MRFVWAGIVSVAVMALSVVTAFGMLSTILRSERVAVPVVDAFPTVAAPDGDETLPESESDAGQQAEVPLVVPAVGFREAVTKKPFGIYITPLTSPVQPDKFTGYHSGADAELPADTPIRAVAEGTVVRSGFVTGYGGMVAIRHTIKEQPVIGIYGHLDPETLVPAGVVVAAGEQVGVLGDGFSHETDGARPHLHFGLYAGEGISVRGYVPRPELLIHWLDPLAVFP